MKKSDLTGSLQELLETMQRISFGEINGLSIRNGQPNPEQPPVVIRHLKFGSGNRPQPEAQLSDFVLNAKMEEFFASLGRIEEGTIAKIEVKEGLPFRMVLIE